MESKVSGVLLVIVSILAILISILSGKNESIILNLGFPAFIAGIFLAFLD